MSKSTTSENVIRHIINDILVRTRFFLNSVKIVHSKPQRASTGGKAPTGASSSIPSGGVGATERPASRREGSPGSQNFPPSFKYPVTEPLVAFFLRAVVLNPDSNINVTEVLNKDEVERLVQKCVDLLTTTNSPILETCKMQVYFDTNFPLQAEYLAKDKASRIDSCSFFLEDIFQAKGKTLPMLEELYRKIVSYLLLRSNIGNPTDIVAVRETTAALESVFPQSELPDFIDLPREEKESQLKGLTQLVSGIRLFNRGLKKGGDTIDNLQELCNQELGHLASSLYDVTHRSENCLQDYRAACDYMDSLQNASEAEELEAVADRVKEAIQFRRQLLIFTDAMQEQVFATRHTLQVLSEKFEVTLSDLKNACRARSAVPVDQVYPLFMAAAALWENYQDELFLLSFRNGMIEMMENYEASFDVEIPDAVKQESVKLKKELEPEALDDEKVIELASKLMTEIALLTDEIEVIHPGNSTQYYRVPVEFGGFCCFSLIYRSMVSPGSWNHGLVKYKDKLYVFETPEAAIEFSRYPDRYLQGVIEAAKRCPSLLPLLRLHAYFPTVETFENARSFSRQQFLSKPPLVSEAKTQTDIHIIDSFLDPNYQWNEWELRRRALMLVDLRRKSTHSSQTMVSHFRRESETQHYPQKEQDTQTHREKATNVPRKVNYLGGLRGASKTGVTKLNVLELSFGGD